MLKCLLVSPIVPLFFTQAPYLKHHICATDTFSFVKDIQDADFRNVFMVSYDVASLFTSIPLSKTIDLAVNAIFESNTGLDLKVPITPKYVFRLNNSLHLFETHCTFLPLFSPNVDILQAVRVTKSNHHLFHDRASKGYASIPGLMSQTYLHACLQRLNTMQISL